MTRTRSVTLPILWAISGITSSHKGPVGIIHLDSHTDANGPGGGIDVHAGAGFRMGLEEGLMGAHRTVQIGRGAMGDLRQDDWPRNAGYRISIEIDEFNELGVDAVIAESRRIIGDGPVYISWDLDVLDPVYAPAVADPETGGISINEALKFIRGLRGINIVGALIYYVLLLLFHEY